MCRMLGMSRQDGESRVFRRDVQQCAFYRHKKNPAFEGGVFLKRFSTS
jgi:hypothetical protein